MLALDEDRHEDRVISWMRVADVRIVVQEGVAVGEVGVQLGHRLGQELGTDDVHREALGRCQQLVVGRDQRAREIARHVEHR